MCEAAAKIAEDLDRQRPDYVAKPLPVYQPPAPPPVIISDEEAALMAKAKALLADYDPQRAPMRPNTFEPYRSNLKLREARRDSARAARAVGRPGR